MKEVVSIMELLKQEYQEIDDVTICDVIIDILDDVYTQRAGNITDTYAGFF